jgi:hypothetical protein
MALSVCRHPAAMRHRSSLRKGIILNYLNFTLEIQRCLLPYYRRIRFQYNRSAKIFSLNLHETLARLHSLIVALLIEQVINGESLNKLV